MIRLACLLICVGTVATAKPICICLKCLSGDYHSFWAQSGSMKPTLQPGQCLITRTAFDASELTPGMIIAFNHPHTGMDWIKRIVATGGQTVQMSSGRLLIDGEPVTAQHAPDFIEPFTPQGPGNTLPRCTNTPVADGENCVKNQWKESLGGQIYAVLDIGNSRLDDTDLYEVPEGHLFVLGDNRDNSIDSRVPLNANGVGFVPVQNVSGILDEIRP